MAITNIRAASVADGLTVNLVLDQASGNNRVALGAATQNRNTVNIDTMTYNGVTGTQLATITNADSLYKTIIFYWLDAALPSAAGTYALATVGPGIDTAVHGISCSGAKQAAPADPQSAAGTTGGTTISFALTADAGSIACIFGVSINGLPTAGADQTAILAPATSGEADHASSYKTANATVSYTKNSGPYAYAAAAIEPASSAPTISAGTPTGTTTDTTPNAGFTTDTATGTARIVLSQTQTDLDAVTNAQVLAGNMEGDVPAPKATSTITVSSTTPSGTVAGGLTAGTWYAAAAQSGDSNVLRWSFTVSDTALAGNAAGQATATAALTRPTLTIELRDIDSGAVKNAVTYAEVYVFLGGVGLLTVLTDIPTSALGIMTLRDQLFDQLGSTYHLMGYTADWSDRFHADAILADG